MTSFLQRVFEYHQWHSELKKRRRKKEATYDNEFIRDIARKIIIVSEIISDTVSKIIIVSEIISDIVSKIIYDNETNSDIVYTLTLHTSVILE